MGTFILTMHSTANEEPVAANSQNRSYAHQILRMVMGRETTSEQFASGQAAVCQ